MIEFKKVTKKFGDKTVLDKLSFRVEEGEIFFILGTSGTGKSVLLKNIVGLLKPDDGEIWLDEEEITHFSEENYYGVRKKCGMVFQNPALFDSMSVLENVAFGLRRHLKVEEDEIIIRVKKALDLVHLSGVEEKRPQQLSFGMQKRVSLARTIALEPKILLFDEPTTGLDPVITKAINNLIKELSRTLKTTSIVVSHDMQCALDIADRIIILEKGHIVAEGSPSELKKSKNPLAQAFLQDVDNE